MIIYEFEVYNLTSINNNNTNASLKNSDYQIKKFIFSAN